MKDLQGRLLSSESRTSPTGVLFRYVEEPELLEVDDTPYGDRRKLRSVAHEAFEWSRDVPLDVLDRVIVEVGGDLEDDQIRTLRRLLGKRVTARGFGEQGQIEFMVRLGILLKWLEKQ